MNRVVAVTGASGGIGSALIRELVSRGDSVLAIVRRKEALEEMGFDDAVVKAIEIDLSTRPTIPVELSTLDRLDGLIHCAGVSPVASVAEASVELWQETLSVNLSAPAELTRSLLPALRNGRGHVIFINAARGVHAVPRWSAYTASRAGLRELADSLRIEEEPNGLKVASVYPDGTATEQLKNTREQFGVPHDPDRCLQPEYVAAAIIDLLDIEDPSLLTEVVLEGK